MALPDSFPPRMSRGGRAASSGAQSAGRPASIPALGAVGWRWRRAALLLSIAAQLITISALASADPLPATWAALLLAIAPAPLAALAAVTPAPAARLAVIAAAAALVAGIAGEVTHTSVLFVPALVALAGAAISLWREGP